MEFEKMQNQRNQKILIIMFSWLAVFLWLALSAALSNQSAAQSDEFSRKVTEVIIKIIAKVIPFEIQVDNAKDFGAHLNFVVRKFAHVGVYFMLGALSINAFTRSGMIKFKAFAFSFLLCVIFAVSDEVHQMFVPGRGPQAADVFIDSIGAFFGIGLYIVLIRIVAHPIVRTFFRKF